MFKIPPGLSAFEEQTLRDSLRYQDMLDEAERALGPGGADVLLAHQAEQELIGKLAHPEKELIEQYRDLTSGTAAQRDAFDAAIGSGAKRMVDLQKELERAEEFAGTDSLARAAERLAIESPVEALRRAAESPPAWDLAGAARMYDTFGSLAKEQAMLEATFGSSIRAVSSHLSVEATIVAAMKIQQQWIDVADPARSFAAFGALSEVGRAIGELRIGDFASSARLSDLLGNWTPPSDFALWDEAQRLATYYEAGIDPRFFDIPASAFEDAARAAGIVQPAPEIRPAPEQGEKREARVRKVSITYRVSVSQDAQAQVNSVELMLREELGWRGATKHGPGWMKKFIHGNVLAELKERQAKARVGNSASLLDFATFGELVQVIQRSDLWESAFSDVAMMREEFRVSVERLVELRNAVGHVRRLDPIEFIWVFAEATRLQRAFGIPPFTAEDE